ncbi:MAG TPA: nucleotidyltransferase family protein, partial [Dehalococcoidia bacterium]|nr:nucleotidyltransferase family protein [Dehalococcoidia bacterium]
MNAVILVGGGGTRLRPLTYAVPKPLIPVLNRPLITHLIANLRRHGVTHVVLAASIHERRIEDLLGDGSSLGIELTYSYEAQPLGSGLAVKQAARDFDGPFFVCNGDVITDLDLSSMAQLHRD